MVLIAPSIESDPHSPQPTSSRKLVETHFVNNRKHGNDFSNSSEKSTSSNCTINYLSILDRSSYLFVIMLFSMVSYINALPIDPNQPDTRPDFICNDDTYHRCVCNRSMGNLDHLEKPCESFVDTQTLSVISMVMKKVNLDARLYNNETYETYFRRRIANIVSRYCEQQVNECPGIVIPASSEEDDKNLPYSAKFLLDEEEPLFDENNVIILQVNFLPRDKTELFFVVTKNEDEITSLNEENTMTPVLITYILKAQLAPLSRVLGGIRIEQLRIADYTKQHVLQADNTKLYLILAGIFSCLFFCYIVACIKVVRDCMQRKRRKRNTGLSSNTTNNYGSCTEKMLPKFDTPNGKHRPSKSITSRESLSFKKKKVSSIHSPSEPKTPIMALPDEDDSGSEEKTIDARSFARMFACDPSQLPPEIDIYEEDEQVPEGSRPHSDTSMQLPQLSNSEEVENALPSVILAPSMSHNDDLTNAEVKQQISTFLSANEYSPYERPTSRIGNRKDIPFDRPLSRRGSRTSTPEQGEECTDTREDTPLPLGDENQPEITVNEVLPVPNIIVRSNTAHKFDHWSSDSEPEQTEVYQPLDEVSDDEKDENHETNPLKDTNKNIAKKARVKKETLSESEESVNSDEEVDEVAMLDRHQYERLRESPIPPNAFINEQNTFEMETDSPYESSKENSRQNGDIRNYYYPPE